MLVCPSIHLLIVNSVPDNYRAKKANHFYWSINLYTQCMYVPATSSFWNTILLCYIVKAKTPKLDFRHVAHLLLNRVVLSKKRQPIRSLLNDTSRHPFEAGLQTNKSRLFTLKNKSWIQL